jgi:phenylalanyl-tRNA synthetase beta chain
MLLSFNWLKDFVKIDKTVDELSHDLTMCGIEVEEVIEIGSQWDNVIVAEIINVNPHPNADQLSLTLINTGSEKIQVVCGAQNIKDGLKIALALPGAELPGGLIIKKSKIRGEVSQGMICSETELGLGSFAEGIMHLSKDLIPGTPLKDALNLSDLVLDLAITPNRSDCLSVIGIAREVSAIYNLPIILPELSFRELTDSINDALKVEVKCPDLCSRYTARLINDVQIKDSPLWMRLRLENCGIRSKNNIVDITNYILLEWGQPLHAFDSNLINGSKIEVRKALADEKFITLDEISRTLPEQSVLICDNKSPVAIGGIMGGLESGIKNSTSSILLESAYFDPDTISKTSRAINLKSESSLRFEKGVDINNVVFALNRAASLISDLAGGIPLKGYIDAFSDTYKKQTNIDLKISKANKTLGLSLSYNEIKQIMTRLNMQITNESPDLLTVTAPSYRYDINREIDLIEEIARIQGYDNIPVTLPKSILTTKQLNQNVSFAGKLREIAISIGYSEVINYSFISPENMAAINFKNTDPRNDPLKILNPISSDQSVMRTTILPSLLLNLKHNQNNNITNIKFFEISNVFLKGKKETNHIESKKISGIISGIRNSENWSVKNENCDFYDIKSTVETILDRLNIKEYIFTSDNKEPCYHPLKTLNVCLNNENIGSLGEAHPDILDNYEIENNVYMFELDFEKLLKYSSKSPKFITFSRTPSIYRDLALIVDKNIPAEKVLKTISDFKNNLICEIKIFDFYQGKNINKDKKSLAFRIKFHSENRSLTDKEVNKIRDKLVSYLYTVLGIELRI